MKVELLDVFGNDLTVVNAARVSFAKEVSEFKEGDAKLVQYLAKHEHISPFFHPQIRFRIKIPIFVAREWFRHTIGFARNEVSRRYVSSAPELWLPSVNDLREKDSNVKQGSKDTPIKNAEEVVQIISDFQNQSSKLYEWLLEQQVAPELARTVLPQSMYTEFIETGSLAAYARLCKLRMGADAQKEIRIVAEQISNALKEHFPVSWAALIEHK